MKSQSVFVATALISELSSDQLACLSDDEKQRLNAFKLDSRRNEFGCGRVLLRRMLEHNTGTSAFEYEIRISSDGKPFCADGPAINISHSGDLVCCAVSDAPGVGVDIESHRDARDLEKLAERFFTADEVKWLQGQTDEHFYQLWVLKEAWLKATGKGISGGLASLNCRVAGDTILVNTDTGDDPLMFLYGLPGMYLGVALAQEAAASVALARHDFTSGEFLEHDGAKLIASTAGSAAGNSG